MIPEKAWYHLLHSVIAFPLKFGPGGTNFDETFSPLDQLFCLLPSIKNFSIMFNEDDAEVFRRRALSREPCNV